jgi:cysteine desulfurase
MQRIYFDNAATTAIDPEVLTEMMPFLTEKFGNPSSIYSFGRETKMAVEQARKTVAKIVNAKPAEIFFTSGGTESSNTAINAAVFDLKCTHIISSAIEHHATLHTVQYLQKHGDASLEFVKLLPDGHIDLIDLENKLQQSTKKTLVTLMHANNEIGNILDIEKVGLLCEKYKAIFHSDAVQTLAHYPLDVRKMKVHFMSGTSHKFHGPKGAGLLFIEENISISPFINGGAQERNIRAGTENVYGIVGFAKALSIATENNEKDIENITAIKKYMLAQLQNNIEGLVLNGDAENGLYTVLNIGLPLSNKSEMLLMNLDINGICVSGGSACSSGASGMSHVIAALENRNDVVPIRFSFCKNNTMQEVDIVVNKLKELI